MTHNTYARIYKCIRICQQRLRTRRQRWRREG